MVDLRGTLRQKIMLIKCQHQTTLKPIGKSIWLVYFAIGFILPSQVACTTTEFVTLINGTVSLNCNGRSSLDFIWRRGDGLKVYIAGEGFGRQYKNRSYTENDTSTGAAILKISSLKSEDAESYNCFATDSITLLHTTQLTVLDSKPTCDSNASDNVFVGPNTCDLDRDDMRFSCAVSYNGPAPRLQYETVNGNQSFKDSECDTSETTKTINCTLTLKAEPQYNGSVFRCKVKTSYGEQYNCSTKVIKILYFTPEKHILTLVHKAIGEKISCSVNSSLKLNFSWIREENNTKDVVSIASSYVIDKEGLYYCYVSYSIKDVSCLAVVSAVQTNHTENLPRTDNVLSIVLPCIVCVICGIIIGLIVRAVYEKRNPNAKQWLLDACKCGKKTEAAPGARETQGTEELPLRNGEFT